MVLVCCQFVGTSTIIPENAARTVTLGGGANCDFVGYGYVGTPATGGFNVFYAKWAPAAGAQTVAVSVTPSAGGPVILRTNTVSYTGVGAIGEIFASAGASTTPSVVATSATGRTLVASRRLGRRYYPYRLQPDEPLHEHHHSFDGHRRRGRRLVGDVFLHFR